MIYNTVNCKEKGMNPHKSGWLAEYKYKQNDRWLKEQFINSINDKEIM